MNKNIRLKLKSYLNSKDWQNIKNNIDYETLLEPYKSKYKSEKTYFQYLKRNKIKIEDEILQDMLDKNLIQIDTKKDLEKIKQEEYNELPIKMKYKKYLASKEWKLLSKYIKEHITECNICGNKQDLVIHHVSYDNINFDEVGCELWSDIAILCRSCHNNIHRNKNILQIITKDKEDYDNFMRILSESTIGYDSNFVGYYIVPKLNTLLKNVKFVSEYFD